MEEINLVCLRRFPVGLLSKFNPAPYFKAISEELTRVITGSYRSGEGGGPLCLQCATPKDHLASDRYNSFISQDRLGLVHTTSETLNVACFFLSFVLLNKPWF